VAGIVFELNLGQLQTNIAMK